MKRLLERLRIRRSIAEELNAHLEEKIADLVESGYLKAKLVCGRGASSATRH